MYVCMYIVAATFEIAFYRFIMYGCIYVCLFVCMYVCMGYDFFSRIIVGLSMVW